jgi:amino acid adenylation domain-containing protein
MTKSFHNLPPEQQAIRDECFHPSGTFVEFPIEEVETAIPARFEKIARMYPDRLAVKMGERSLTYGELNQYANRIAHAILEKRGPRREPIALVFEQSIDLVAAILGVLKAGTFYVALDSSAPIDRLRNILTDSRASMLISNSYNSDLISTLGVTALRNLNTDELPTGQKVEEFEPISISPNALVNITYTSGSTGTPKGVTRMHGRMVQSALSGAKQRRIDETDRLSLIHSVSFGSASTEVFQSLLNGAALCLFDIRTKGIQNFARFLKSEVITICHLSPGTLRSLVGAATNLRHLSDLRLLYLSGAPITRADFELYKHTFPTTTRLELAMGSTEAGSICHAIVDRAFRYPDDGTPVGYAARGKKVLLLDDNRKEVERGEVGEIAVTGANLNPGYWNKPELTSERYLSSPDRGDEILNLTGDLGRMLPDGFVIHLGRKDLMVKIRGYRVDLSEVERSLLEHSGIKEAGVAAWEREPGEKYLAGYIVPHQEAAPNVSELRKFLSIKLPDYMIPSTIMFMESLPLTNGKLDRHSLPKPDHKRPELGTAYAEASDPIEKRLVNIWEEILDMRPIGIDDNFFDLGGHSLLAARLFTRMDEEFGRLLSLSTLVDSPTVRLVAEHFRSAAKPHKISALVRFTQTGSRPGIFAVPGVYGNVVGLVDLCRELGDDQPFYGLQSIGLDGQERAVDSIEAMAQRYVDEIRTVQPHGPYTLLGACFGACVTCEMASQLLREGEEIRFLALLDPIGLVRQKHADGTDGIGRFANFPIGEFLTSRLRLYLEEMRGLSNNERARFLTGKLTSLAQKLGDRKVARTVQREVHQLAVFNANRRAGQRYRPKRLEGRLGSLEVFVSEHSRKKELETFDWIILWQGKTELHQMPGKDSGDMLSGENARVLAALLKARIQTVDQK